MERFLSKVALWLEKIRSAPVIGSLVEDLITIEAILPPSTVRVTATSLWKP